MIPKVAIYCRLSEEDRNKQNETDDSGSIKNQKEILLQYAMSQGWELYNIYSDDDFTGSDRSRPEFNRLLSDAETHKFDIILCKTQSRFTREMELVEKYIHGRFPLWGIRFIGLVDHADTDNRGNKKARQINGLVNEWYLEEMSENIRSVLNNRRKNGHHIGAFALYGYKKDPDIKGHLSIDNEAAPIVREVFTLIAQGYGKSAIARILNDRGIPNPTEYKRLKGLRYKQPKGKSGTLWKYSAIASMITNEMYIGNMVQGKYGSVSYKTKQNKPRAKESWYRVKGTHEPIIERELWDRVQAIVAQRAKPFEVGTIGLFARKARCIHCGYVMRSSKNHGKHYLQCSERHVAKDACAGAFIAVDKLEQMVIDELRMLSQLYLDKDELERQIEFYDDFKVREKQLYSDINTYQKKIEESTRCIRNLYVDKVKEVISEHDYKDLSKEFTTEKERAKAAILRAQTQLEELAQRVVAKNSRRELMEQYLGMEHLTREMVEVLIDYISVGKRIPGTKDVPIEIHWSF